MPVPTTPVHHIRMCREIQRREQDAKPFRMFGLDSGLRPREIKLLDALMPEGLDHTCSVTRYVTQTERQLTVTVESVTSVDRLVSLSRSIRHRSRSQTLPWTQYLSASFH